MTLMQTVKCHRCCSSKAMSSLSYCVRTSGTSRPSSMHVISFSDFAMPPLLHTPAAAADATPRAALASLRAGRWPPCRGRVALSAVLALPAEFILQLRLPLLLFVRLHHHCTACSDEWSEKDAGHDSDFRENRRLNAGTGTQMHTECLLYIAII